MHSADFTSLSDRDLMVSLVAAGHKPSMLVLARDRALDTIVASLVPWCERPAHVCTLPGLTLPAAKSGTIFISDLSVMTLAQQIELYDWLDAGRGQVQVVSVTSQPMWPLVEQGLFLEGLFYRLNTVSLEADQAGL